MLAESTLPTMRYDVPIAPRVTTARPAAPKFASEAVPEPTAAPGAPWSEAKEAAAVVEASAAEIRPAQELVPVPASVFDDDFFKASPAGGDAVETGLPERFREPAHAAMVSRVQHDDAWRATAELPVADPLVRAPSFGGAMAVPADHAEPDELDIPAFLRRSN